LQTRKTVEFNGRKKERDKKRERRALRSGEGEIGMCMEGTLSA